MGVNGDGPWGGEYTGAGSQRPTFELQSLLGIGLHRLMGPDYACLGPGANVVWGRITSVSGHMLMLCGLDYICFGPHANDVWDRVTFVWGQMYAVWGRITSV